MGRYAYFSTSEGTVEYKFWFGIQSTDDIEEFGGEPYLNFSDVDCDGIVADAERNMDEAAVEHLKADLEDLCESMDGDDNVYDIDRLGSNFWVGLGRNGHRWFDSELSDILQILTTESDELKVPLPDWDKFNPDNDGVEALIQSLEPKFNSDTQEQQQDNAHFTLGCVIYLLLKNQSEDDPLSVLYDC